VNDDEENVSLLGEFVSSLRKVDEVDVLPYHELGISKYKRLGARYKMHEIKPPSNEEVARIAEQLRGYGLNVKIGG
jgi:pyruvate formate lyase activating enzyme